MRLPSVWLSPAAEEPGRVKPNQAPSWASVHASTSAGSSRAASSPRRSRRSPSSARVLERTDARQGEQALHSVVHSADAGREPEREWTVAGEFTMETHRGGQ